MKTKDLGSADLNGTLLKNLTLGIPAYNRSGELCDLFDSILKCVGYPTTVLVIEDCSGERELIRGVVSSYKEQFKTCGVDLQYIENDINLGYDKNIKKLISKASGEWLILIGNDDKVTPDCFLQICSAIERFPLQRFFSRSFYRFTGTPNRRIGLSRLSSEDTVFSSSCSDPGMLFRSAAFVGGLVINVNWARQLECDKYDGGLYYQVYLSANAFCQNGIGYISRPIVEARIGNCPLFGTATIERTKHSPGWYSPKSRGFMWSTVLSIGRDIGDKYGLDLVPGLKRELGGRQSFHVFEMMAGASKDVLDEIWHEYAKLGLQNFTISIICRNLNWLLGQKSRVVYRVARRLFQ
jgi:glycosyltransferase involved in cell wall biosynthesis